MAARAAWRSASASNIVPAMMSGQRKLRGGGRSARERELQEWEEGAGWARRTQA